MPDTFVTSGAHGAPVPNSNTGLAIVLLGDADGYRLYFHDGDMHVHQLLYAQTLNNGIWSYGGAVSKDVPYNNSNALVAQVYGHNENISVAYPKDDTNIEVSRIADDNLWHICETFPFPWKDTRGSQPS